MSESDFTLVKRRNRRRCNRRSFSRNEPMPSMESIIEKHLLRRIDSAIAEIKDTSFSRHFFSQLKRSLKTLGRNGLSEIVCYGLGQFSYSRSSKYQLALLLLLKARYNPIRVYVYDPKFYAKEIETLLFLGLEVIETNEEGKRSIEPDKTTLMFMPHCSWQLVNNFLYANWADRLNSCILFTNSFSNAFDNLREDLNIEREYILRIQPYVTEFLVENSFEYDTVFNDLNFHIFTEQNLLEVPENFWITKKEPKYMIPDCKADNKVYVVSGKTGKLLYIKDAE